MTILLLGATGRTGKWLLQTALERGHTVHALVRDESKVATKHPSLKLFTGAPTDEAALNKAMQGCEAIISALNISRTSDFPWAKLRTPPTLLSDTMQSLIKLAPQQGISRVVITSAWCVGDGRKDIPKWFAWVIENSNIKAAYDDHLRQEELLEASSLQWTAVRPVGLTNSKKDKPVYTSLNNNPKPRTMVSRKVVAKFMVGEMERKEFVSLATVLYN